MIEIERGILRTEGTRDAACEASEIGLAPGEWPMTLQIANRFGRPIEFDRVTIIRDREGDVLWGAYVHRTGATSVMLRVYND